MRKVVYNACFGGFGLSDLAVRKYFELKNQQIWAVPSQLFPENYSYYTKNPENLSHQEKNDCYWNEDRLERHDPDLVKVVETLGSEMSSGNYAELSIATVYGPYRISEYDGNERVQEPEDLEWR